MRKTVQGRGCAGRRMRHTTVSGGRGKDAGSGAVGRRRRRRSPAEGGALRRGGGWSGGDGLRGRGQIRSGESRSRSESRTRSGPGPGCTRSDLDWRHTPKRTRARAGGIRARRRSLDPHTAQRRAARVTGRDAGRRGKRRATSRDHILPHERGASRTWTNVRDRRAVMTCACTGRRPPGSRTQSRSGRSARPRATRGWNRSGSARTGPATSRGPIVPPSRGSIRYLDQRPRDAGGGPASAPSKGASSRQSCNGSGNRKVGRSGSGKAAGQAQGGTGSRRGGERKVTQGGRVTTG